MDRRSHRGPSRRNRNGPALASLGGAKGTPGRAGFAGLSLCPAFLRRPTRFAGREAQALFACVLASCALFTGCGLWQTHKALDIGCRNEKADPYGRAYWSDRTLTVTWDAHFEWQAGVYPNWGQMRLLADGTTEWVAHDGELPESIESNATPIAIVEELEREGSTTALVRSLGGYYLDLADEGLGRVDVPAPPAAGLHRRWWAYPTMAVAVPVAFALDLALQPYYGAELSIMNVASTHGRRRIPEPSHRCH